MDQTMLVNINRIIIGPTGRRLPAYADIKEAYVKGVYADYYQYNPTLCIKSYYKQSKGAAPYPHFLGNHYSGSSGYRRTLSDMSGICNACCSISLLHQIQEELYQWVTAYLPPDEASALCRHYVKSDADRDQIAGFFATVMHHAHGRKSKETVRQE